MHPKEANFDAEGILEKDPSLADVRKAIETYDKAPSIGNMRLIIQTATRLTTPERRSLGTEHAPIIIRHLRAGKEKIPHHIVQDTIECYCMSLEIQLRKIFIHQHFQLVLSGDGV